MGDTDETQRGCCLNCGERLAGEYCHACGQRDVDLDRGLLPLLGDALSETFEADGRLPRTILPFLFSPGAIVRAYLDGRRQQYASPVRTYVFALFVGFLVFGVLAQRGLAEFSDEQVIGDLPTTEDGSRQVGAVQIRADDLEDPEVQEGMPDGMRRMLSMTEREFGVRLTDTFLTWTPRLVTLGIPLYAGVLQLLYWRRRYLEHLVFALDQHSRALLVVALCVAIPGTWDDVLGRLYIAAHLLVGLRVVYGLGWLATAWRAAIVVLLYGTAVTVAVVGLLLWVVFV